MKKILITGGAGFIGSNLTESFVNQGENVIVLDLEEKPEKLSDIFDNIEYIRGDVRNRKIVQNILHDNNIEGIVHLAAVSRVIWGEHDPERCIDVNINGTRTLVDIARKSQCHPWMIFGSSREVYGESTILPVSEDFPLKPVNIYGKTKIEGERLIKRYSEKTGSSAVILRFSNVYGNERDILDRVIPKFILSALNKEKIEIHGGNQVFDFTHIDDTVDGIMKTVQFIKNSSKSIIEHFHILTGKGTTLQGITEIISYSLEHELDVRYTTARKYDVERFTGDPEKTERILGFKAKTLPRKGIPETVKHYRDVFEL